MTIRKETVGLESAVSLWLDEGLAILALFGIREDGNCACGKLDCEVPGKHPRHRHGAYDATRNLDRIRRWIEGYVHLNLGLFCSGFQVYDCDGRVGERSLEQLQELYGYAFPETKQQTTGNGRHLIYRGGPGTTSTRLTAGLPGLHLRGGPGSYIVGAPSKHRSGRRYICDDETPIAELPAWAAEPPPGHQPPPVAPLPELRLPVSGLGRYGLAALRDEANRLLLFRPGEGRHDALNTAAFRMGQLVVAGQLEQGVVEATLSEVAEAIGLLVGPKSESERIIGFGLEAGKTRPR